MHRARHGAWVLCRSSQRLKKPEGGGALIYVGRPLLDSLLKATATQMRPCAQVWSYDLAGSVYAGGGSTPTFPAADYPYAPSYKAGLVATGRLPAAV